MANKKKKIIISNEKGSILYESEEKDVIIFNDNGILYFEFENSIIGESLKTYDCAEGVAALMKLKNVFNDDKLWNLKVGNNRYDISVEKALYWLSGGNREWNKNDTYIYNWKDVCSIFEHKFGDIIYEIVENSETLNDIKEGFLMYLNLPVIYEFALNNNLIK